MREARVEAGRPSLVASTIVVAAPNSIFVDWLQEKHLEAAERAAGQEVQFICPEPITVEGGQP